MDCLFHVTAVENGPLILAARRLASAAQLVEAARADCRLLGEVRIKEVRLATQAVLNDQRPMQPVKYARGVAAYLQLLNRHVFFWPSSPLASEATEHYPRKYGERYLAPDVPQWDRVLLRLPRQEVERANHERGPRFSKCNTGAPDHRTGDFTPLIDSVFSAPSGDAVEVVYQDHVLLPERSEIWNRHESRWQSLETQVDWEQAVSRPINKPIGPRIRPRGGR